MSHRFQKIIFLLVIFAAFLLPPFFVFAQETATSTEEGSQATPQEERQALEDELKQLEEQIAQYDEDITKTAQQKNTLQNQISLLTKKISQLNLQISQSNVMIKDLSLQINDTEGSIDQTNLKILDSRSKLSSILQIIYEEDQKSLVEMLLSEKELSDFFDNLMALEALNAKSQEFLQDIKNLKSSLEIQKQSLDQNKSDLESVVKLKALQKQESETTKKEQNSYLKLTETQYQASLQKKTEAEKRAAEIRARIFELIGVPEAPTFGEALDIAKYVESVTGVRPAFLLAVLTQESNIGKNVGQCFLKDPKTGDGVVAYNGKEVSRVMKPSRDVGPFLTITQELGRDPYNTPVSCPMSYGYGGAMGPAQFIPSTWMLYKDKAAGITGKAADPWNIKDAFLAAALYLADYGATKQTYNAEWKAAMIYFSGSTNTAYRFYGDSVMKITAQYESDIKELEGT
ncbi:MAG: lytic murein transglycosylase [Candidatus Pacebacteria bacterium]|nr:lytic murein transglycosylase [Candidatus Paceibacterota bacterium]